MFRKIAPAILAADLDAIKLSFMTSMYLVRCLCLTNRRVDHISRNAVLHRANPSQPALVQDLHDVEWRFSHIYRGIRTLTGFKHWLHGHMQAASLQVSLEANHRMVCVCEPRQHCSWRCCDIFQAVAPSRPRQTPPPHPLPTKLGRYFGMPSP